MNQRPSTVAVVLTALGVLAATPAVPAEPTHGISPISADTAASAGRGCTGRIALTFDDGPAPGPTGRAVDLLRHAGVPATFFMLGSKVATSPRLARRVERAGFLLGNHSWAHMDMTTQTAAEVKQTLLATRRAQRRAGTHPTRLMRPPYGALDATARAGIKDAHMVPVLWTVDPRNWESGTAAQIAQRILAALRPGDNIVLQHDGVTRSPISVEAVPAVVRGARQRGYCFTALNEAGRPGFPTPRVSVTLSDAAEGARAVATVRLSKPAGRATSVRLRTRSRTAGVGSDVARIATRVEVPAGRLAARVRIPLRADGIDEPTEEFAVRLTRPRGLSLGADVAVARVFDRDPAPIVRGVDVTVPEPAAGPEDAVVEFRLSRRSGHRIRIVLRTFAGTANGTDYIATRQTFVLAPGKRAVVLPVTVLADAVDEPDETFSVAVVRAVRVRPGRDATVTIAAPSPPKR